MYDVIIVGSGASGAHAAHKLSGKKVLMLDVGYTPENGSSLDRELYQLKKERSCLHDELIGKNYESMHNIDRQYLSPKLKAPYINYVIKNGDKLGPVSTKSFFTIQSFAKGGLANAWGAGTYRYTEKELKHFPVSLQELKPFYDELTNLIGISGTSDDLQAYYGSCKDLLPPMNMNGIAENFLQKYNNNKEFFNKKNIFIGKPRLAVLTRDYNGRKECEYNNLEFFTPNISAVYNPAYTIDQLVKEKKLIYKPGCLALEYCEDKEGVSVKFKDINSNKLDFVKAKKLILSAGTLNSSKIVLVSNNDTKTKLPLLDSAISYVPLVNPCLIGRAVEKNSFAAAQLNIILDSSRWQTPVQATFYGMSGPLKSDYLLNFPFDLKGNITAAKYLSSAMAIVQLFYPDQANPENYLKLNKNLSIEINYTEKQRGSLEKKLISACRHIGYYGHPALCQYPEAGNSFHYAGTLPMKETPGLYQTYKSGLLFNTKHVYIADAANFPFLPSKNHTFTIMANAMRIADMLRKEL